MSLAKAFGAALKKAREDKDLTQAQLGAKIDVGWQRISAYEKTGRVPLPLVEKLAHELKVSVWVLLKPPGSVVSHDDFPVDECAQRLAAHHKGGPDTDAEISAAIDDLENLTAEEGAETKPTTKKSRPSKDGD